MSGRTRLNDAEMEALKAKYTDLPGDYFEYLRMVGWGEADSGRMIYSGPISPKDIYGERFRGSAIVLVGDDMQGCCFGFDRGAKRWGEISNRGTWEPGTEEETFGDYARGNG